MSHIKRWGLFFLLSGCLGLFLYFHLYRYLSFENLKVHRIILIRWAHQHFLQAISYFMAIYTLSVAISVPGAAFLTLVAGFLFGPLPGIIAVIISATLGSFIVFMAVDLALREWVSKKTALWTQVMEKGFQDNAFSYLLFLRLVPLFPFWLVNIMSALLGVSKKTFVSATILGIIPGTFVYVMIGNGLGHLFDVNETPNLRIVFDPLVLIPLLLLAFLSLVPVIYKYVKDRKLKNGT